MAIRAAAVEQPKPTRGDKVVKELLLESTFTHDEQAVVDDIILRLGEGEKKYGSTLMSNNGRNVYLDIYQELCDASVYMFQAALEQTDYQMYQQWITEACSMLGYAYHVRESYLESIKV